MHQVTKRESQDDLVIAKIQRLCQAFHNETNERKLHYYSPKIILSDPSEIKPIRLGNQCRLYVRIKHPLFVTQKIGLVSGIQYQGKVL